MKLSKKAKKINAIDEKIAEIEAKLKDLKEGTDEFDKTLKSLNLLKESRKADDEQKLNKKKSRRETGKQVADVMLRAGEIAGGIGLGLAIYSFDSTGNCSTSKIANFIQQNTLKKFLK